MHDRQDAPKLPSRQTRRRTEHEQVSSARSTRNVELSNAHGGGTRCGLRQSRGAWGSQTFTLTCEMSILDLNPMRCTASWSSTLHTERRGDGELCIKMTKTATRVGSICMQATHLGEILASEKHDQPHGRRDERDGGLAAAIVFDEVLTKFARLMGAHLDVLRRRRRA